MVVEVRLASIVFSSYSLGDFFDIFLNNSLIKLSFDHFLRDLSIYFCLMAISDFLS